MVWDGLLFSADTARFVKRRESDTECVRAVLPVRESLDSRTACAEGEVLMAIAIGSAAPAFECQSHTGATLKLSDYAGKKLLIWFYPRACTGG